MFSADGLSLQSRRKMTASEIFSYIRNGPQLRLSLMEEESSDILWICYAQRAFDSWFRSAYYLRPRQRWTRRGGNTWVSSPPWLHNQITDWPARQLDVWHYQSRADLSGWQSVLNLSNAFHCWQRARHQMQLSISRIHFSMTFVLLPLAKRHELPDAILALIALALFERDTLSKWAREHGACLPTNAFALFD